MLAKITKLSAPIGQRITLTLRNMPGDPLASWPIAVLCDARGITAGEGF